MRYRAFVWALAALALASCVKDEAEIVTCEGTPMTIHAYQEEVPATRTTVVSGGMQVFWEPGDEIKVFFRSGSGRFVSQNTGNVTATDFSGTINFIAGANEGTESSSLVWGLYPYREDATFDGASVTTTLPAAQTGRAGSFAQHAHITLAKPGGLDLAFFNVCGGLRFSVTQEGIQRVTFEGNNGETLAGRIKLAFVNGAPAVQEIIDGQSVLELIAPDGGTFQTGQWYYFEALPGALSKGYKMVFYKATESAELTSSNAVTFRRGAFGSLSDADAGLVFQPSVGGEAVDLGLSVKWASTNVGANAPEDYGYYFAWGETEQKTVYSLGNYKWWNGTQSTWTKYSAQIDNKTTLDLEDDAARANWGGNWRMPTAAEWLELINKCTCVCIEQNGVYGMLVTATNGNSIFLPDAGYKFDTYTSSGGEYWSSSLADNATFAKYVYLSSNPGLGDDFRYNGISVRPVLGGGVRSVSLNSSSLALFIGSSKQLTATVSPADAVDKKVTWSSNNTSVATVEADGTVTAVAAGTATITATTRDGNYTATCAVTVASAPESVDLGLSVKWASCNVGAIAPEGYGDYFAWGETEPYYEDGYAQSDNPVWKNGKTKGYDWDSYRLCNGGYNTLTKYNTNNAYGPADNKTTLDLEDDAARDNWGGSWRMPTKAEWTELRENCTWNWTTRNGVNGMLVTAPNGNSIFLPAAGNRRGCFSYNVGSDGDYWSSSLSTDSPYHAWHMNLDGSIYENDRYYGRSVRPVLKTQ